MGVLRNEGSSSVGVFPQMEGAPPGQKQSATLSSQLYSQSSKRFKDILMQIEDSFLIPFCDKLLSINQQFIDAPYAVQILGRDGVHWQTIMPNQIAGKVNFVSLASSKNIEQGVRSEQLMHLLQIAGGNQMLWGTVPLIFVQLAELWRSKDIELWKMALGYHQVVAQLEQAMNMGMTPQQMMLLQNQQAGLPAQQVPQQQLGGNSMPYGGEQEQTPTNSEEMINKNMASMTRNLPVAI